VKSILFTKKDTAELVEEPMPEPGPGWWTQRDDALAFLRLVALGRIDLSVFVEEVHSPAECGEVYSRLAKGDAFPTVQFNWEDK